MNLKSLDRWLLRPSPSIKDPLEILRVRILTTVLAVFILLLTFVAAGVVAMEDSGKIAAVNYTHGTILISLLCYVIAYILSRTRFHAWSGLLFLVTMTGGIAVSVNQPQPGIDILSALLWLILLPAVSALVYPVWATILTTTFAASVMIFTAKQHPDLLPQILGSDLALLVAVTAFITVNSVFRAREENRITIQRQRMIQTSKLSTLGEMAAGVAHEINNPLAIIRLRSEQLREKIRTSSIPPEKVVEGLDKIEQTVLRISRIVKSLLSFAREANHEKPVIRDLKSIFQDTIELCNERFRSHGVDLRIQWPDEAMILKCKPVGLSQVLMNLLSNAHDASVEVPLPWVAISARDLGETIEISVSDNGKGVPEEIQERIFEPFFTTKPVDKGTGLGLSLSKGLIESEGGKLLLIRESAETRFVVIIPKGDVSTSPTPPVSSPG